MFKLVKDMNTAFGNPEGNPVNINWTRLEKQIHNIHDEYKETLGALAERNLDEVRDGLCDIMVFALGGFHFLGIDANADMKAVIDGVMTRFCKDQAELDATIAKYTALEVDFYVEGEFPTRCLKSTKDQKDKNGDNLPMGKFLKAVGYSQTVFSPVATA